MKYLPASGITGVNFFIDLGSVFLYFLSRRVSSSVRLFMAQALMSLGVLVSVPRFTIISVADVF
jgi:hypothetical protein